jgi:hypothetical protein
VIVLIRSPGETTVRGLLVWYVKVVTPPSGSEIVCKES